MFVLLLHCDNSLTEYSDIYYHETLNNISTKDLIIVHLTDNNYKTEKTPFKYKETDIRKDNYKIKVDKINEVKTPKSMPWSKKT